MLRNMKGQFAEHLLAAGFVNSRSPRDPKSNINSGKCGKCGWEMQSVCFHFFVKSASLGFSVIHRQWEVTQSCYLRRFISKGSKNPSKLQQKEENVRLFIVLFSFYWRMLKWWGRVSLLLLLPLTFGVTDQRASSVTICIRSCLHQFSHDNQDKLILAIGKLHRGWAVRFGREFNGWHWKQQRVLTSVIAVLHVNE